MYSLQLHCQWLNKISALCLIFINNLHVYSCPLHWRRVKPFLFLTCPIYLHPEIGLYYSFCAMSFDHSVSERTVKWKYFTCELIIRRTHSPFFWWHNDLFLPLAWMNLSLSLSLNELAQSSKETRAGMCFTALSELTCGWAKCHSLIVPTAITSPTDRLIIWRYNSSFHFIMILASQHANVNSHT